MEKAKSIMWRLYLTVLSCIPIAMMLVLFFEVRAYIRGQNAKERLQQYISETYNGNIHSWKPSNADGTPDIVTQKEWDKLSDAELETIIHIASKTCLEHLIATNGYLSTCFKDYNSVPKKLSKDFNLNYFSRIGHDFSFEGIYVCLIFLCFFLGIRYWGAWLFTGIFPRKFP